MGHANCSSPKFAFPSANRKTSHPLGRLSAQQQHIVLCTAQHLHNSQILRDKQAEAQQELEGLKEKASEQAQELEDVRERLRNRQETLRAECDVTLQLDRDGKK